MTPADSDAFGDGARQGSRSQDKQLEGFPIWNPNLTAQRALKEENVRLREDNERLKRELSNQNSNLLRSASALRDEHRWRAQAEHSWAQSVNDFSQWFGNAVFAMTCVAWDGRIVHANRAALELLGYQREEYLGKRIEELIVEEEIVQRIQLSVDGSPLPQSFLAHIRSRNGLIRPVLVSCQLIEHGGSPCVCLYTQEASVAKREKTKRLKPQLRLRELGDNIREVLWVSDINRLKVLYVSSAFETVFGMKRKFLYRRATAFLDVVHPEDRQRVKKAFLKRIEGATDEYRLQLPDGSIKWVRDRTFVIRNPAGKLQWVAGTIEDITTLKRAEMALAMQVRQQKALIDLGKIALENTSLQEVLENAVQSLARILNVEFVNVLKYRGETNEFVMRAAVGWPVDMIGRIIIPAEEDSLAQFTLQSARPVVVDNLATERRFGKTSILKDWGISSCATILIGHRSRPFGILSMHSRSQRKFSADDVHFLETVASLLSATADRVAAEMRQENLSLELLSERQRMNDIVKSVPGVVWEIAKDGPNEDVTVTFVSRYVEELTGFPQGFWLGSEGKWIERIHPDDRDRILETLRIALTEGQIGPMDRFRLLCQDGSTIWLESRHQVFSDSKWNRTGLRGVLLNVSSQVEAESDLRLADERFRAFMNHTPMIAFIKDSAGKYLYANRTFRKLITRSPTEWMNKTDAELFAPNVAERFRENDLQTLEERRVSQAVETCVEDDGTTKDWVVFKFPLTNRLDETCVGGIGVDITDRRRLEREILEISDRERRGMGQDLHDGLCQHLLGLAMMSVALADRMERAGLEEAKGAREISRFLYDAVELARGLMRGLHLVNLEGGGLSFALEEFCNTTSGLFGRHCEFQALRPFFVNDKDLASHLFRIAQEATNNAMKHGNAENILIQAREREGGLVITVEDDGVGLPETISTVGFGFRTMRYRADLIGASFSLTNRKDGGVRMECSLPQTTKIQFT